jgi:hypothetical protein
MGVSIEEERSWIKDSIAYSINKNYTRLGQVI